MTTFESFTALEARNQKISAGITLTTGVALGIMLSLWMLPKFTTPPLLEEKEEIFEIVGGGMDYGDFRNGSMNVNNFHEASDDPKDAPPKAQPQEVKTAQAPSSKAVQTQEHIVSTDEPAEVVAPPPAPKPTTKQKITQERTEPAPVKKETKIVKKPKVQSSANSNSLFSSGGGSNHGNGSGIGNRGTPESKILNSNGLYSFGTGSGNGSGGEGEGGLNGRRLLYQVAPQYDSQEEGRIRFKITVSAKGEVKAVKALNYSGQMKLKRAVEESLRQWKFSPKDGNEDQVIIVTYTFKLK